MYDGFCLAKHEKLNVEDILEKICEETGVKWIEKPNTSDIEIDEDFDSNDSKDYFTQNRKFEKKLTLE